MKRFIRGSVFMLAVYFVGLAFGYGLGKHGADRWYAKHWVAGEQYKWDMESASRSCVKDINEVRDYCIQKIHEFGKPPQEEPSK